MGGIQSEIQKAKQAISENDFDKANDICIAALKESEDAKEHSAIKDRLEVLVTLSDICKNQDRLLDNINYLRELTKGAHSIQDNEMLAKGLVRIGFVFNRMGKRDRAMDKFNEAEELTKNFENKVQYGYVLAGKANIYWRTGDSPKALEAAQKVMEIGLQYGEHVLAAGAANVMSSVKYELGDFDEALKHARVSVETYRNIENKSDLARALNNLGEIYKRMKNYDMAIESYNEGISVLGEGTKKRMGYLYTNMAECQTKKGDLDGADVSLQKAMKLLDKSEDKYAVTCMWYVVGILEDSRGRTGEGLIWLRKAEEQMSVLGVPYDLGVIRLELAKIYMKSSDNELALDMAKKALDVLEKAGAKDLVEEVKGMIG